MVHGVRKSQLTFKGMLAAAFVFIGTWLLVGIVQARWHCTWSEMDVDSNGRVSIMELVRASDYGCSNDGETLEPADSNSAVPADAAEGPPRG